MDHLLSKEKGGKQEVFPVISTYKIRFDSNIEYLFEFKYNLNLSFESYSTPVMFSFERFNSFNQYNLLTLGL